MARKKKRKQKKRGRGRRAPWSVELEIARTLKRERLADDDWEQRARDEVASPRSVAGAFAAYLERHRDLLGPEWAAALLAFERYAEFENAERQIALYEQALAQAPPCFYVEACMGDLHLNELGNVRRALRHFRAAVGLAPDLAMTHYSLGLVLHLLGNFERSREQYELALELAGDDGRDAEVAARASFNVAAYHINRGRSAEAEPLLRRALELMPGYPEARRAAAALGLDGDPLARLRRRMQDRMLR